MLCEFQIKSSSAAVLAASSILESKLAQTHVGPNRSNEAASTADDDDYIRVETCTDPCGPNQSDEAAGTAADDDYIEI